MLTDFLPSFHTRLQAKYGIWTLGPALIVSVSFSVRIFGVEPHTGALTTVPALFFLPYNSTSIVFTTDVTLHFKLAAFLLSPCPMSSARITSPASPIPHLHLDRPLAPPHRRAAHPHSKDCYPGDPALNSPQSFKLKNPNWVPMKYLALRHYPQSITIF